MGNNDPAPLIEEMSNSLHREVKQVEARLDGADRRLDDIAKTQKRHSALFSADAIAVRGMERTVPSTMRPSGN